LKQLSRQIKKIEKKEKKASYGVWRKEFCKQYVETLIRIQNNTRNALIEDISSNDKTITCRKGCTHCCFHYVTVSLAHGIVIVDYLYKKKDLLRQFIGNYEKWHNKGHAVSDGIDRTRLKALSSSMSIDRVMADTRPLSSRYLDMNIQCPFLLDNQCFIYNVRPMSCSGHFSVSPPDWCAHASGQEPVLYNLVPNDEDLMNIMRLTDTRIVMYELTLPTMIHKLLNDGSSSVMNEMMRYNFE
jgi:Fe-S-cluster containining protein